MMNDVSTSWSEENSRELLLSDIANPFETGRSQEFHKTALRGDKLLPRLRRFITDLTMAGKCYDYEVSFKVIKY
ncbi:unnamed protein product [Leptosia nina]|uniref:Uncharacterized protein n=1 Tax=Leptosia nina TaxID=320188 RepID=A0AAV1IYJ1_9NEOP